MDNFSYPNPDYDPDITDDDLAFISSYQSGKMSLEETRQHVLEFWRQTVTRDNLQIYRCIAGFQFLQPRLPAHFAYEALLPELKAGTRQVLEVGCCFGTDLRTMLQDGVPVEQITETDLVKDYWESGKLLYRDADDERIKRVRTFFGDATQSSFLPDDNGKYGLIINMAVLHTLSEQGVRGMLTRFRDLLQPGRGVLIGVTGTASDGPREWKQGSTTRWLHSRESLEALLKELGFAQVTTTPPSNRSRTQIGSNSRKHLESMQRGHVDHAIDEKRGMVSFSASL